MANQPKVTMNDVVSIDRLVANPWNTNIMTPENEARVQASITRLGMFKPILVREKDDKLEILGGQHRWEVLKKMGKSDVPVFNLGKVSDKKAKEIGLADNAKYGHDDTLALSDLLKELGTIEDMNSFLPYNDDEINAIFSASSIALGDLEISDDGVASLPPERPAPTSQIMRFKIPVADAAWIALAIEQVTQKQSFTSDDAMTNAGNALVHILNEHRKAA
jgi:ParB-like chromosome segregation protein Spo0J